MPQTNRHNNSAPTMGCCAASAVLTVYTGLLYGKPEWSECRHLCGPSCYAYGPMMTMNGTNQYCGTCSMPLIKQPCDVPNRTFDMRHVKVSDNNNYVANTCVGQTCVVCNGSAPLNTKNNQIPANATIYVTHACKHFTNSGPPSTIHITVSNPLPPVTIWIQKGDTLVTNQLTVSGSLKILSAADATLHIQTKNTNNNNEDECALSVTSTDPKVTVEVVIKPLLYITGAAVCGLGLYPSGTRTHLLKATASLTKVAFANVSQPYIAAIANVIGSMSIAQRSVGKVLLLETADGSMHIHNADVLSLSSMMSVFGRNYEIEYYNDGNLTKSDRGKWVAEANSYLLYSTLILTLLRLSNPTFGARPDAAVDSAEHHRSN